MTEQDVIEILKAFPEWNSDDQWLSSDDMEELVKICSNAIEKQIKLRIPHVLRMRSEIGLEAAKLDIQTRKTEFKKQIQELKLDIERLNENIKKAEEILSKVKTEEDVKKYEEYFDIENGLKHIELLW